MWQILNALVVALFWSAVAEFLLLRTFLRLGPVLPATERLLPGYQAVEIAGLVAMNMATLAAAALAVCFAGVLLAQRRAAAMLLGCLILAATIANIGLELLLALLPTSTVAAFRAATVLTVLPALYLLKVGRRGGLSLGLIAIAGTLAVGAVSPALAGLGLPISSATLLGLAETAAVAAALVLPLSFRPRWQRRDLIVGAGAAFALLAAHTIRPSMFVAMAMWNFSFTVFLPGVVYAIALGAFTATVLALRREGNREVATGLLLIALAGLKLDFTYFALMTLVGFMLCCRTPRTTVARRHEYAATPAG